MRLDANPETGDDEMKAITDMSNAELAQYKADLSAAIRKSGDPEELLRMFYRVDDEMDRRGL